MTDWSEASAVYLAGNEKLFDGLIDQLSLDVLDFEHLRFPDGESYVRVDSDVTDRIVLLFCSLDRPDSKFLPMMYTAETLRDEGADSIVLAAPYLVYMRQDKQFRAGEGVTSRYFAEMIDRTFDGLLTVDPHLHRYNSMNELYETPCTVTHADPALADWIDKTSTNRT